MRWVLVLAVAIAIGGTVMPRVPAAQNVTTLIEISRMDPGLAPDDFTFWRTGTAMLGIGVCWRIRRRVIDRLSRR